MFLQRSKRGCQTGNFASAQDCCHQHSLSLACTQAPSTSQQRLLLAGADGAKPAKTAAVPKEAARENGDSAVPVTANSADANGASAAGVEAMPEKEEVPGQLVELKFRAPRAGKYDLTLYCISGTALLQAPQSLSLH